MILTTNSSHILLLCITAEGAITTYAEGLGIALDREGSLYVGDRSGTIFKIAPVPPARAARSSSSPRLSLAFNGAGTLFVTGPTTSSRSSMPSPTMATPACSTRASAALRG